MAEGDPSWKAHLLLDGKGKFRTAEFYVDNAESEIGRRVAVHEFPNRDYPTVEDLGRANRKFRLTCFVLGPKYDEDRDKLRAEFEKPGPGQLTHPYWGEMQVSIVSPVKITETPNEGGLARFDLDVVETEQGNPVVAAIDFAPEVNLKALVAITKVSAAFSAVFTLVNAIEATRSAAVSLIQGMTSVIKTARKYANAAVNLVDDVEKSLNDLITNASALVNTPEDLVNSIDGAIKSVFGNLSALGEDVEELILGGQKNIEAVRGSVYFEDFRAGKAKEVFDAAASNGDDTAPVQETGSGQDEIQIANQAAIISMFQAISVIEAAVAFAEFGFESRDKAIEIRDSVAESLDAIAEDAADEVYAALMDLKAALSNQLSSVAATLPELITVPVTNPIPSLALTYDIYGSIDNETDLIFRNNIAEPHMVPSYVDLKVVVP
jgi:prophage DNA circulation protein